MPPSDKEVKTAALLAANGISTLASVYKQGNSIEVRTRKDVLKEVIEGFLEQANISGVQVVVVENL